MKANTDISPGPWELRMRHTDTYVGEERVVEVERYIRDVDGLRLATIGGGALSPEAADFHIPNARVMTAAPQLLVALEGLCDSVRRGEPDTLAARAAIAAARGEARSNALPISAEMGLLGALMQTAAALELYADPRCCDGDEQHEDKCKAGQALRVAFAAIAKARGES